MAVKYVKDFEFPSDFGFHGSAGRVHVPSHSRSPKGANKSHIGNEEHGNDYAHGGHHKEHHAKGGHHDMSHIGNEQHSDDYAHGGHHKGHKKYAKGGHHVDPDAAEDKAMVKKGIRQHENHEHGGKHTDLKLRKGGEAMHHAKGGTHINVKMPARPPMGMVRPVRSARPVAPPGAGMGAPMAAPMGALNAGSSAIPQMSKGGHNRKRT